MDKPIRLHDLEGFNPKRNQMLLISSSDLQIQEFFEGYCFVGVDYIFGHKGATEFRSVEAKPIVGGHDGCYVTVYRERDGWTVATDYRGLAKIYYYNQDGEWAISNSLAGLVRHLRATGISLEPNMSAVLPFGIRDSFNAQISSTRTPFKGVSLLPAQSALRYVEGEWRIRTNYTTSSPVGEDAFREYLDTWQGRLVTLATKDEISFEADLSGGLDSRTALSFLLAMPDRTILSQRLRIASNERLIKDYASASLIANAYDIKLNQKLPRRATWTPFSLEAWDEISLGVYLPLYFAKPAFDSRRLQIHGAGGENYRPYYGDRSIQQRLDKYRARLPRQIYDEWRDDVITSINKLKDANQQMDDMVLHYREFRNRFHFGHMPQWKPMFTPLNTYLLDPLVHGGNEIQSRQIYFDIMESLAPGLMNFPYDDVSKNPNASNIKLLTSSPSSPDLSGRVFGTFKERVPKGERIRDVYNDWLESAFEALQNKEVLDLVGSSSVSQSLQTLSEAASSNTMFGSHNYGILELSYARLAAFVLDLQ